MSKASTLLEALEPINVGDPVIVNVNGSLIKGNVRAQILTNSKVRYSVSVLISNTGDRSTLHNIDSALLELDPNGDYVEFGEDNYS